MCLAFYLFFKKKKTKHAYTNMLEDVLISNIESSEYNVKC